LVILAPLGSGCSLFEPREAEKPGSGGTPWQTPTVPTAVFRNMESGLEDLTGVNYERSLNDGFTFIPEPNDAQNYPQLQNWTQDDEVGVVQRLVGDASDINVTFTNTLITDTGGFAQFEGPYKLVVKSVATGETTEYRGRARYDLIRSGTGWQLSKWEDIEREPPFATWGFLRATLKQTAPVAPRDSARP